MSIRLDGLRILVLDDDGDLRDAVAKALGYHGAKVETAVSAADALARAATVSFDVIVVDIGMPLEDGYTFLRQLHRQDAADGRDTRVIALTGYATAADRTRAAAAGFELHLSKPIDQEELALAVRMTADGNAAAFSAARRDIA